MRFLKKDKVNVKDVQTTNVKLLKRNVFGHMAVNVRFVGKENQQEDDKNFI